MPGDPERTRRFEGPVVIALSDEDPGDMGDPREFIEDGLTYLVFPSFGLWAYNDLRAVVEYADAKSGAAEGEYPEVPYPDGVIETYAISAADWNRIVAVARGHKSDAAQRVIDSVSLNVGPDGRALAASQDGGKP